LTGLSLLKFVCAGCIFLTGILLLTGSSVLCSSMRQHNKTDLHYSRQSHDGAAEARYSMCTGNAPKQHMSVVPGAETEAPPPMLVSPPPIPSDMLAGCPMSFTIWSAICPRWTLVDAGGKEGRKDVSEGCCGRKFRGRIYRGLGRFGRMLRKEVSGKNLQRVRKKFIYGRKFRNELIKFRKALVSKGI
jgi:hypothetical protein